MTAVRTCRVAGPGLDFAHPCGALFTNPRDAFTVVCPVHQRRGWRLRMTDLTGGWVRLNITIGLSVLGAQYRHVVPA